MLCGLETETKIVSLQASDIAGFLLFPGLLNLEDREKLIEPQVGAYYRGPPKDGPRHRAGAKQAASKQDLCQLKLVDLRPTPKISVAKPERFQAMSIHGDLRDREKKFSKNSTKGHRWTTLDRGSYLNRD